MEPDSRFQQGDYNRRVWHPDRRRIPSPRPLPHQFPRSEKRLPQNFGGIVGINGNCYFHGNCFFLRKLFFFTEIVFFTLIDVNFIR